MLKLPRINTGINMIKKWEKSENPGNGIKKLLCMDKNSELSDNTSKIHIRIHINKITILYPY